MTARTQPGSAPPARAAALALAALVALAGCGRVPLWDAPEGAYAPGARVVGGVERWVAGCLAYHAGQPVAPALEGEEVEDDGDTVAFAFEQVVDDRVPTVRSVSGRFGPSTSILTDRPTCDLRLTLIEPDSVATLDEQVLAGLVRGGYAPQGAREDIGRGTELTLMRGGRAYLLKSAYNGDPIAGTAVMALSEGTG